MAADAVVVAAGASSRMAGTDKVATLIGGRPLLAWTLEALAGSSVVDRIVLVGPAERLATWQTAPWLPATVAAVVAGGERRQESVRAGVREVERLGAPDDRVVLVHDGARPCLRPELVAAVVDAVEQHGAAIPVVPVAETLKRVADGVVSGTVERDGLAAAQTPQGARLALLLEAFERFPADGPQIWTDEAALLEACRIPVHAIPGHPDNLKVTLRADLERAASVLVGAPPRVGFGDDSHRFGAGDPLVLGGVEFAGAPRLHGHSDGDVALHAVADALLGAAGLGDLGRLFPPDTRTPRGIDSAALVRDVVGRLSGVDLRAASVDLVIVAARPRLGARLDEIRARVAELVGVPVERVNVKASSGNLVGMEGAGRGISARAVATVEPAR